ncbi:hypothetical protein [Bradyrhizobium sp. BWA-3-5]|uniref:hypothetical protein n=1 Tax=Bradyrhizobium sp. BWA-3-5 TaxID=3080013 RepID=UPI00293EC539|nr:hypothetical protein [Bradyrhizobium sp. BWA-3-5]WOH62876.1 hypothetical protein RX331_19170 [Bradyrhizobium sp. BWA-3-5]
MDRQRNQEDALAAKRWTSSKIDNAIASSQPPPEASSPPVAADEHRAPNVFPMSAAIIVLVVVVGISIALLIPRPMRPQLHLLRHRPAFRVNRPRAMV